MGGKRKCNKATLTYEHCNVGPPYLSRTRLVSQAYPFTCLSSLLDHLTVYLSVKCEERLIILVKWELLSTAKYVQHRHFQYIWGLYLCSLVINIKCTKTTSWVSPAISTIIHQLSSIFLVWQTKISKGRNFYFFEWSLSFQFCLCLVVDRPKALEKNGMRSKATIKRLQMYRNFKPIR